MTVALFGGSFSPVHEGHMAVAEGVLEKGLADEVWLMPCRRNPLKDGTTTLDDKTRLRMLSEVADFLNKHIGKEVVKISDIELHRNPPSYTCDTLKELMIRYPSIRFRIVVGTDSYLEFQKWKEWQWIEENFNPIAYPRPNYEVEKVRPSWTLLEEVRQVNISSTEIRRLWNTGNKSSQLQR